MRALCKRGLQTHHGGRSLDGASEVGADHFASVALFLFPLASSEKGRVSPQVPFVAGAFYLMCCVLVLCGCFETSDAFVILGTTLSAPLFCVCNNNSKRDYAMVSRGGQLEGTSTRRHSASHCLYRDGSERSVVWSN